MYVSFSSDEIETFSIAVRTIKSSVVKNKKQPSQSMRKTKFTSNNADHGFILKDNLAG